jgi:mannitol 2-dehydrogenase
MIQNLSNKTVGKLDTRVSVPSYDRSRLVPRLVHIGLGHFHRAHYLSYLQKLLNAGFSDSGVYEVDIVPVNNDFIHNLKEQDFLYSLQTKATDGTETVAVNGGIVGYANASTDPQKVLDVLTNPVTQVISLTITEKGYCYDDKNNKLNKEHPQILTDLCSNDWPETSIGFLAKALKIRFENNRQSVTILSCDNIPVNGEVLKRCLLEFIEIKYPDILSWVKDNIAFPCTMVDRITPGTSTKDTQEIRDKYGFTDNCPVLSEDFIQWVIEDTGCKEINLFSQAGASVVKSVKPYELMKIRLLNGSHSALSYPAYLMGIKNVDKAITNPLIYAFIRENYMEEITQSLPPVSGMELTAYKDKLVSRFANKNIADQILRLAGDGSKKISNAIIKPLLELKRYDSLVLVLAFWARFLEGTDEQGNPIPIDDPLREKLMQVQKNNEEFLAFNGITSKDVLEKFTKYRKKISDMGAENMLMDFLKAHK